MAIIYDLGLARSQNPLFGISHTNIAKKLTLDNYIDKAIMRGGDYIWITKAMKHESRINKDTIVYLVSFMGAPRSSRKEFSTLQEAIDCANNWDEEEGEYPLEREAPAVVRTMPYRA